MFQDQVPAVPRPICSLCLVAAIWGNSVPRCYPAGDPQQCMGMTGVRQGCGRDEPLCHCLNTCRNLERKVNLRFSVPQCLGA